LRPITIEHRRCCGECRGARKINHRPCPVCGGQGEVRQIENYQVKIPAGVREGQRLRVPTRPRAGDSRSPGSALYLRVCFEPHPDFHLESANLCHTLNLAPWEAVLGATVSVPTLDGRLDVRIPAGSQSGQKLRVRGHGLPTGEGERGDLFIVIRVEVPHELDDVERRLWERMARESHFRPRD
jgi:curved DNA-binding protein